MKSPWMKPFAEVVFAGCLGICTGFAQGQSGKEAPKAVSLAGCLVKGDEPDEVWLAQEKGTIYGLESSKIELKVHLGQKVIVKGFVLTEGKEEAGRTTQEPNGNGKTETADFRVLTLKVITTTCRR
jgi:hypothetical protein